MDCQILEEADWLFRKMVRRFVKERDKILIEGITLPSLLILRKISREGEQRLGDLAEQLDFTSGAVTALCDKLEKKGFAVRRKGEDRRTVLLDITDEGRKMCLRNQNIGSRCTTVLFDGFSEDELSAQIKGYHRILGNLERFSEVILELARENVEQAELARRREKIDQAYKENKFLSY
jgi:DNA-binding MarR family transcriptional regulator